MKDVGKVSVSHMAIQQDQHDAGNSFQHESAERIFNLLLFLFANHDCTRKEIFEHLASYYRIDKAAPLEQSTSRRADRMFERDINFLEDLGFEIKKVRGKARLIHYSLVKGSGPRASFLFTHAEVDSLALLHNLFADPTRYARPDLQQPLPQSPPRNPFSEEILAFIEKLASTLPLEQRERFDRSVSKPFVYFNLSTVADYLPHRPIVDTIVRAISHRQQIQFNYTFARNDDGFFHEHIDPYYITFMDGHFYLIAFCHKNEKFLEYRIDRIKAESLREMPNMIDMERRRQPFQFRFWLDSSIAKRGVSQRWLTQMIEHEEAYLDEQSIHYRPPTNFLKLLATREFVLMRHQSSHIVFIIGSRWVWRYLFAISTVLHLCRLFLRHPMCLKKEVFVPMDWEIFGFTYDIDSSEVLQEYIEQIANKKLLYYKGIIHYGGKAGESL